MRNLTEAQEAKLQRGLVESRRYNLKEEIDGLGLPDIALEGPRFEELLHLLQEGKMVGMSTVKIEEGENEQNKSNPSPPTMFPDAPSSGERRRKMTSDGWGETHGMPTLVKEMEGEERERPDESLTRGLPPRRLVDLDHIQNILEEFEMRERFDDARYDILREMDLNDSSLYSNYSLQ
eukprot:TRINITY_DN10349_c0_g1_i2.p1 TRINITY_DN10349_c0_g1~~TRINITY_DN10349_c0_g1_i2.p1  ORF type:complete len:178 (+),score=36.77 TRINITY_DN10349_c0_g1_i2:164-697(+)